MKNSYCFACLFTIGLIFFQHALSASFSTIPPSDMCTSQEEVKPYIIKEFQLADPGNLKVKTFGGSIHISGYTGSLVKVQMYVRMISNGWKKPSGSEIGKALDNYDITIAKEGNQIYAIAEPKNKGRSSRNNMSISFTIYVPHEISCDLETSGGSININDLKGNQKVVTSGGSIHCKTIDGNVKAYTSGGSIHIENYDGELDASTSGGAIMLKNANGILKIHTSEGGISLNNASGTIEAVTSGGSISANMVRLDQGLILKTSGGNIYAIVPSAQGVDLDLSGSRVSTQLENFSGKSKRDKIVGSMNGGGVPITLSTEGGSVNLEFKN